MTSSDRHRQGEGGVYLRGPLPPSFVAADEGTRRAMVGVGVAAWVSIQPRVEATLREARGEDDAEATARFARAIEAEAASIVAAEWRPKVVEAEAARWAAEERLATSEARSVLATKRAVEDAKDEAGVEASRLRFEVATVSARCEALTRRFEAAEAEGEQRAERAAELAAAKATLEARGAASEALHAAQSRAEVADGVLVELRARFAAAEARALDVEARLEASRKEAAAAQRRATSSVARGADGEAEAEVMLADVLPHLEHATLDCVGREAHRGDYHLECGAVGAVGGRVKLLVDVKNYTRAVGADERRKLHADVERDPAVAGGLLVSLRSRVASADHYTVEHTTPGGKPILYVCLQDLGVAECGRELLQACRLLRSLAVLAQGGAAGVPREAVVARLKRLLDGVRRMRRSALEQAAAAAEAAADVDDLMAALGGGAAAPLDPPASVAGAVAAAAVAAPPVAVAAPVAAPVAAVEDAHPHAPEAGPAVEEGHGPGPGTILVDVFSADGTLQRTHTASSRTAAALCASSTVRTVTAHLNTGQLLRGTYRFRLA